MSEEVGYHFETIHSAKSTDDGKHIVLHVTGATGICGISIAAKDVPRGCAMLFQASAEARRKSRDDTIQAVSINGIKLISPRGSTDQVVLAITVETGAAPIAFQLSEKSLVDFALGILQTKGLLNEDRPSKRQ